MIDRFTNADPLDPSVSMNFIRHDEPMRNEQPRPRGSERRLIQLERLLRIMEIISALRYGTSLSELRESLADAGCPWCERTLRRDLNLLIDFGFVRKHCEYELIRYRASVKQFHRSTGVVSYTNRKG
jgi:hypothetical protein